MSQADTLHPFEAVLPKPRGKTGPNPTPVPAPTSTVFPIPSAPPLSQLPPMVTMPMGPWSGMTFPSQYMLPPPNTPMKQAYIAMATGVPPPSPTRASANLGHDFNLNDTLHDWFAALDLTILPNEPSYSRLLDALNIQEIFRISDILLTSAEEIVGYTQCSLAQARRIIAKAKAIKPF
jgi:hypothetical protein